MKIKSQDNFLRAKIHQLPGRFFSKIIKQYGINKTNPSQGRNLFILWENDELTIIDLSKKTQLEKSTLTAMLDLLKKNGLMQKITLKRTNKDGSFLKTFFKFPNELFWWVNK